MRIYLDLCVYNRPFDDQRQPRIAMETLAFIFLLAKTISGEIITINSFVLEDENSNNPYIDRRDRISDALKVAAEYVGYTEELEKRAKEVEKLGIMGMDALHIACAEKAKADFLVTCDDLLVKKWKRNKERIRVKIMTLLNFITKEVFKI
jgi:predicted nucleic acid-binding protein